MARWLKNGRFEALEAGKHGSDGSKWLSYGGSRLAQMAKPLANRRLKNGRKTALRGSRRTQTRVKRVKTDASRGSASAQTARLLGIRRQKTAQRTADRRLERRCRRLAAGNLAAENGPFDAFEARETEDGEEPPAKVEQSMAASVGGETARTM